MTVPLKIKYLIRYRYFKQIQGYNSYISYIYYRYLKTNISSYNYKLRKIIIPTYIKISNIIYELTNKAHNYISVLLIVETENRIKLCS